MWSATVGWISRSTDERGAPADRHRRSGASGAAMPWCRPSPQTNRAEDVGSTSRTSRASPPKPTSLSPTPSHLGDYDDLDRSEAASGFHGHLRHSGPAV